MIQRGMFSVKSVYHLGVTLRDVAHARSASSSSSSDVHGSKWTSIWNLKMPGNMKIFLWRLVHNSLPLRLNIQRKHVELDTRCPVCARFDEDGCHLFLRCKFVKQIWRELNLEGLRGAMLEGASAMDMLQVLWTKPQDQQ